ncbi:hypothetical protein A6A08_07835 [Nocardiopsis sp. TSRI0078]|uniref:DUF6518 family protein n=1 Tax=unclassified Nocardiopsis TaxID=2649073 RepID=UPI0009396A3A|nr:DUF6518 family protein [Nocardiopsis sp. TSRI0078]OKI17155.1 hypothetical protein A6A08_07835 [Nocardiopsis sp. TSRI0078]
MQKVSSPGSPSPGFPSPRVLLLAALAGPALGALTLVGSPLLPWWIGGGLFTDAAAGWCFVVILLGMWAGTRLRPWQVPVSGAAALLGAVVCYYAVAAVITGGPGALPDLAGWLFPAWLWLLAACVAGPVLTGAGAWILHERRSRRLVGLGLVGGVFLADALLPVLDWVHFRMVSPEVALPSSPVPMLFQSAFHTLLGAALVLVMARVPGDRPRALVAMVPAGLVWYAGVWGAHQVMFLSGMGYLG